MVKIGPRFIRRRSTPIASQPLPPPPKRALLIGINYDNPPDEEYGPLRRARSDTKDFRDLLISKYDYPPENIVMMLDEPGTDAHLWPTRENILQEIRQLVKGARAGSRFVFFYSGHSDQLASEDNDEDDGFDEFIVPVDHSHPHRPGTAMKKRIILDNKLRKMLVDPLPVGAHLTAIFDSCHSGTLLDLDHYLCNNVYHPWTDPGRRRYMTRWQGVRRKDGQRMSQSGVRVITKKHKDPHNTDRVGSPTSQPSRENSGCSVRIYQRKRVSDHELEVFDTSVGVSDTRDGKRRRFSVQSRRTSIQSKPSLSVSQVLSRAPSMDSLAEDGDDDIPRCASPISIRTCNGFCANDEQPPHGGTVLSLSSCHDDQRTWESKSGSFTQWLIELLRLNPRQPIGHFVQELTHKMYLHARKTHQWSRKQKDKYLTHVREASESTKGTSDTDSSSQIRVKDEAGERFLDSLEYVGVPEPQLGSRTRINMKQSINL